MDQNLGDKNHLMFLNYNKKRHPELLEYSQYLKQQGKSLSHESRGNFLELSNYSATLDSQLDWEARDYYLELLDQLVKKRIPTSEFFFKFSQKSQENSEVLDFLESKLVLLSPHEKSLDFSDFINEILDYCESFNNDSDSFIENYDLLDNQFRDSIEKIYLRLQNFLKE